MIKSSKCSFKKEITPLCDLHRGRKLKFKIWKMHRDKNILPLCDLNRGRNKTPKNLCKFAMKYSSKCLENKKDTPLCNLHISRNRKFKFWANLQ